MNELAGPQHPQGDPDGVPRSPEGTGHKRTGTTKKAQPSGAPDERSASRLTGLETPLSLVLAAISGTVAVTSNRPASAIGLLIAVIVITGFGLHRLWAAHLPGGEPRFPRLRWRAAVLATAVVVGLCTAFAVPDSRNMLVHRVLGFVDRSGQVTVESLRIGTAGNSYRLQVAIRNGSGTEELLKEMTLRTTMSRQIAVECTGDDNTPDRVKNRLTVTSVKAKELDLFGSLKTALDKNSVAFAGRAFRSCKTGVSWLELHIPAITKLAPKEYTIITMDIPQTVRMKEAGKYINDVSIAMPTEDGPSDVPSAVEVVLSISGGRVTSYRKDHNYQGPILGE